MTYILHYTTMQASIVPGIGDRDKFVLSLVRSLLAQKTRTQCIPASATCRFFLTPDYTGMRLNMLSGDEYDIDKELQKDVGTLTWEEFYSEIMKHFKLDPDLSAIDLYDSEGQKLTKQSFDKQKLKEEQNWKDKEFTVTLRINDPGIALYKLLKDILDNPSKVPSDEIIVKRDDLLKEIAFIQDTVKARLFGVLRSRMGLFPRAGTDCIEIYYDGWDTENSLCRLRFFIYPDGSVEHD